MIERINIFELIGNSTTKYHSAILTTYTFDPIYFSTYYLSKLKSCGINNIIVMVDSANYDKVTDDYEHYGDVLHTGSYTLIRQQPSAGGVFHPKIVMLIGQKDGLMLIGSGNLTYSGQSVNEEVWGCLWLKDTPFKPIFGAVWNYIESIVHPTSLINQQLTWMKEYSEWLEEAIRDSSTHIVTDEGDDLYFLFNRADNGVYHQLKELLSTSDIKELDIVSPFYDTDGSLLKQLNMDFKPNTVKYVVYQEGTYPSGLIQLHPNDFVEWRANDGHNARLHAKIYQFKTNLGTYVVIGSANATVNGWRISSVYNDEAVLLLHVASNHDFLKDLGISLTSLVDPKVYKPIEHQRSDKEPFDLVIYSAEIIDGQLFIEVSKNIADAKIEMINAKGEIIKTFSIINSNRYQIDKEDNIKLVVFTKNDKEISNRCLVISDETIANCNPNPIGHKLTSLFNSGSRWDDNIAKILEYVAFDMPSEKEVNVRHKMTASRESSHTDKIITEDQFDNISSGNRYSVQSMNNVRIVDYLRSFITYDEEENDNDEVDQNVSEEERENGTNIEGEEIVNLVNKRTAEEDAERSILKYIELFNKHMDKLLKDFDCYIEVDKDRMNSDAITKPQIGKHQGGLNEYSSAVICIALLYQLLKRDKLYETNVLKLRNAFVLALGSFLLYYHQKPVDTHDYRYRKICSMYNDMTVFALLCIAKTDYYRSTYYKDVKLLILNLFDFYYDMKEELNGVVDLFRKSLDKESDVNTESVKIIFETYHGFINFRTDNIQEIDLDNDEVIEWSKANGFAYRDYFKSDPKHNGQLTSRYFPCGYHNCWFKILSGKKIVQYRE